MKQSINPVMAAVVTVLVVIVVGLIGFKVFTAVGSSSLPQANPQPADPNDERFKPRLPQGLSGGSG